MSIFSFAALYRGFHLGGHAGVQAALILLGFLLACALVWVIQRAGRSTT